MSPLRKSLAAPPDTEEVAAADDLSAPDSGDLVQHPDGWYWLAPDGKQEFGPFDSAEEARADMLAAAEGDVEPGETLEEAEDELGLATWVDPDTGSLAEGTHTRLEDH